MQIPAPAAISRGAGRGHEEVEVLRGHRPPLWPTDLRISRSPDFSAPPSFSHTGPVTEANLSFPALLINMQILIFGRMESNEEKEAPCCCRSGAMKRSFLPSQRLTPAIASAQVRIYSTTGWLPCTPAWLYPSRLRPFITLLHLHVKGRRLRCCAPSITK